jgi:hypothetical protein
MQFEHTIWIGIYPAPQPGKGRGLLTYAALDNNLKLLALSQGDIDELKAYASGQSALVVAISSPRRPSSGLPLFNPQGTLFPESRRMKPVRGRMADRQLREHNLGHLVTPGNEELCPAWMCRGFRLFELFAKLGYHDYPVEMEPYQLMEVYTQATFTLLSGEPPLPRNSLEGRLQRQLLLNDKDVDVPDPMRFFEEVTRYRLRNGILPLKEVYLPAELDALAAAYTAWLAITSPHSIMLYGDEREGQVVVPVGLMMPKLMLEEQNQHEYARLDND